MHFDWLKTAISIRQAGEKASKHLASIVFLSQIFRYFSGFDVVILVVYLVLLFLGKCLMDS